MAEAAVMRGHHLLFGGSVAFLLGILAASAGLNFYGSLGVAAVAAATSLLFYEEQRKLGLAFVFFGFIGFLGFFYYHFYVNAHELQGVTFGEKSVFRGVVINEPQLSERAVAFTVSLSEPAQGKLRVVGERTDSFRYGDLLELTGVVEIDDAPAQAVTLLPKIKVLDRHRGAWLKEKLLGFKAGVVTRFRKALPVDAAALMSGITLGVRSDFTEEFKQRMAASGTTHLVALSGYNIAIVALAVSGVLGRWLARRATFYVTLAVIALFVLMVGGEPSVVRAAIMGLLLLLARETGRQYYVRNAIAVTAAGMALVNPAIVMFDLGFILSFVSLLGIVYLEPALNAALRFKKRENGAWGWKENLTTTAAAQLAVAPILLERFGQFSATALLANVLILEFVPLTMFLGFLLAAVSFVSSWLGLIVGWVAYVFLSYEIAVIKLFSLLDVPLPFFVRGLSAAVLYYLVLVFFAVRFAPSAVHEQK